MAGSSRGPTPVWTLAAALLAAGACEITEVTISDPEDVVIVEALVTYDPILDDDRDEVFVLLHRTFQGEKGAEPVSGALVIVTTDEEEDTLAQAGGTLGCDATIVPGLNDGSTCYGPAGGLGIDPGDVVTLRVELPDGRAIEGATRVPSSFDMVQPAVDRCFLLPDRNLPLLWTQSPEAWAYVVEASIQGLAAALANWGIRLAEDPFNLFGLAISATDTSIVLPSEFGVFDRFELERELALLLQDGLPSPTTANMAVAAVDRNYVNWVRGADFNPSGQVKIPSVVGDGVGFFGSAVFRTFLVNIVPEDPGNQAACDDTAPPGDS